MESAGASTVEQIIDSLSQNQQNASGGTANRVRHTATSNNLSIFAPHYFPTLETGMSSQMLSTVPLGFLSWVVHDWSEDKGLDFEDDKARWKFAYNAASNMKNSGSQLFREGGRTDLYTDKVQPLVERLSKKVAREFIDFKIIRE